MDTSFMGNIIKTLLGMIALSSGCWAVTGTLRGFVFGAATGLLVGVIAVSVAEAGL